eukprot:3957262-Pleurochrysis_carterae.AAC.1
MPSDVVLQISNSIALRSYHITLSVGWCGFLLFDVRGRRHTVASPEMLYTYPRILPLVASTRSCRSLQIIGT